MAKKQSIPLVEIYCPFCCASHYYKISEQYRREHGTLLAGGKWKVMLECPVKHLNKTWLNVNLKTFTVIL